MREYVSRLSSCEGGTHPIYDAQDNLIAETDGAGTTVREYVWHGDVPVAVLDGSVTPATPTLLWVYADHLKRPEMMRNAARTEVWRATYEPFGATVTITGSASHQGRLPGQWYQLEAGLAYNWHRHYDATLGRYTQPDPLGLDALRSDGPSVYGYAGQSPQVRVDPEGLQSGTILGRPKPPITGPFTPMPWTGKGATPWWWSPRDLLNAVCTPLFNKPPNDAKNPDGAKAPGKPGWPKASPIRKAGRSGFRHLEGEAGDGKTTRVMYGCRQDQAATVDRTGTFRTSVGVATTISIQEVVGDEDLRGVRRKVFLPNR